MNKAELIEAVSKKTGITKTDVTKILNAITETVIGTVKKGNKVTLIGFGTFEARKRSARTGRNPQTGKEIKIKACKAPAFKAGKAFKEAVNK